MPLQVLAVAFAERKTTNEIKIERVVIEHDDIVTFTCNYGKARKRRREIMEAACLTVQREIEAQNHEGNTREENE